MTNFFIALGPIGPVLFAVIATLILVWMDGRLRK